MVERAVGQKIFSFCTARLGWTTSSNLSSLHSSAWSRSGCCDDAIKAARINKEKIGTVKNIVCNPI